MNTFDFSHLGETGAQRIEGIKYLVDLVEELTGINAHGEARLAIAEYFGLKYHAMIFKGINAIHSSDLSLKADMRDARFATTHDMWTKLEAIYGHEVLQPIKDVL